ncbi:MAG: ferredoxin family protein [Oscillospiraceae bacterium]|nr:ferredoxin family protein [Oscillospiraceae bacterium]MBR1459058.1 ferredoxin family protein [Oscillospiraceae bacterium]MBR1899132.1 ferredoxin family protein [Oscillospiraceae bacterium]
MSIRIDSKICIGCGRCHDVCPGTLIKFDSDHRAYIKYPRDCWGCTSCVKECPVSAIRFYLGADIGGQGSMLHTEQEGEILRWIIEHPDGRTTEIQVNRKESNQY